MTNYFIKEFIVFGGLLGILMGVSQIIPKNKKISNWMLFILFTSLGIIQLQQYYTVIFTGQKIIIGHHPIRLATFFIGPAFYLFFNSMLQENLKFSKKILVHFIPAIIIFISQITVITFYLLDFFNWQNLYLKMFRILFNWLGILNILFYFLLSLIKFNMYSTFKIEKKNPYRIIIPLGTIVGTFILIVIVTALILKNNSLLVFAMFFLSFLILLIYLAGIRYPQIIKLYTSEIKQIQYQRTLLKDINLKKLNQELTKLMEDEKLYCDEDISLNRLASHLLITPHQLSEFLNSRLNQNFNSFINKYRIDEAKKLLIAEKDTSIISIAFMVGFGTQSAFYDSFSKLTGLSPSKYRKNFPNL